MAEPWARVESTGDSIAHALREEILAGRLTGGERLVEEAIAKRYGVSRVPVREALTRLQSEGFVTIVRYRGAAVSETLVQDSRELLQIRRGLEILAAQLAAAEPGRRGRRRTGRHRRGPGPRATTKMDRRSTNWSPPRRATASSRRCWSESTVGCSGARATIRTRRQRPPRPGDRNRERIGHAGRVPDGRAPPARRALLRRQVRARVAR